MTDESRGSPLPQRERGATEAGARPAPARVGVPALPDDLRQRMKASVDAERAQNRERAAETFHELYEGLAPASQRHFEMVTAAYC